MAGADSPLPPNLGRFQVVRQLGEGGMGAVYEGVDASLGRHVALKVLSPHMAANPEYRERFRREAVAMAQVAHPHVLQVYELGEHEGTPFFAMERVEGGDCQGQLARGPVPVAEVVRWIHQAALGLAAAAARGLVHRDVKPANLMLHQGQVKVADFGIAREVQGTGALTRVGMVMGTPDYIAPEQAMGAPVDLRADIYALGATCFHLLAGRPMYQGNPLEVMQAQVDRPAPDVRSLRPEVPDGLAELLRHMLGKRPDARPQSYAEVLAGLAPFLEQGSEGGDPGALVFTEGPTAGKRVELPQGEFVVGRQADCHLVLDSQNASRRHALFYRDGRGLQVRDLGSRNGVLVNGVRTSSARLKVGDRVRVGSETFAIGAAAAMDGRTAQSVEVVSPRLGLLQQLAQRAASGPLESYIQLLPELVRSPLLGLNRLALVVWEAGRPRTLCHEGRLEEDRSVNPLQSAILQVQGAGQLLALPDARVDARFQVTNPEVAAVLCAPLRTGGPVFGVLYADAREPRAFSPDDLALFEAVAALTSLAVRPPPVG
jgi:serine/threonine-protein kinase